MHATPASPLFAALMDDSALEPVSVAHYVALGGVVLAFAGLEASVEGQIAHAATLSERNAIACERLEGTALERCAAFETAVRSDGEWRWTSRTNAARNAQRESRAGGPSRSKSLTRHSA